MGKLTRTSAQIKRDRLLAAAGVVGFFIGIFGVLIAIAYGVSALVNTRLIWPWIIIGVAVIILAIFIVYKSMEREDTNSCDGWDDDE